MKNHISAFIKTNLITGIILLTASGLSAQAMTTQPPAANTWYTKPEVSLIAFGLVIMLFAIYALGKTTMGLSKMISKANKKSSATILLLLVSASAFAQQEVVPVKTTPQFPAWAENPTVYLFGFLFIVMLATILALYKANMRLMKVIAPPPAEDALALEAAREKKPSFLHKLYLRMVDSVPVQQEKDILLDHDYDGIKELDNNLPPWWKYGFYVTIVFAFIYMFIYHVSGTGKLQGEEYKQELAIAQQEKEARLKASADNINEENVTALADEQLIAKGKETFQKLCVACHRADGGGQVGPNLTDEFWLHGGGVKNIFKTITYGVPNKGMISWQSQLSPKQIQQVASYILTLKGTNPAGAKEPQGDKWTEEATAPADSAATGKATTDTATLSVK